MTRVEDAARPSAALGTPLIVWMTAPDGATGHTNRSGTERLGVSPSADHGWGWLQFVHPEDVEHTRQVWESAVRTRTPYYTECRLRRADGSYRWYLTQAAALRGSNGNADEWVGTWTDTDERH